MPKSLPPLPALSKAANRPYVAGVSPEMADYNAGLKAEALKRALKAGLLGLAGGAGLASLLGLPQFVRPLKIPSYPLQTEVELPYPQVASEEEKDRRQRSKELAEKRSVADQLLGQSLFHGAADAYLTSQKADDPVEGALYGGTRGTLRGLMAAPGAVAGGLASAGLLRPLRLDARAAAAVPKSLSPAVGRLARAGTVAAGSVPGAVASAALGEPLTRLLTKKLLGKSPAKKRSAEKSASLFGSDPGKPTPPVGSPGWLRGDSQTDVAGIPWAIPAAAGAGLGGLVGGHALVRHLLKRRRKAELDRQLAEAQKDYEEAMLSQYDPSKLRQLGGVKSASDALDACYDAFEKAGSLPSFDSVLGRGAGLYATGAGLLGLGTGYGVYKWLQSRSSLKTLRDALKRRAILRSLQNPAELYVRPVPVEYVEDEKKEKSGTR